jgi:prepilin-type N-terminal cleavage/methylation domain-containing protein
MTRTSTTHLDPSAGTPPRRVARSGYTLLEVLIVMTISMLVAGLAVPKLDFGRLRSDAGVRAIRSALQQAQRHSVQSQFDVVVTFDLVNNRVRLLYDANNDGLVGTRERKRWINLAEGVRFAMPIAAVPGGAAGLKIAGPGLKTISGNPTITFHRNGSASTDLQIYLSTPRPRLPDFRAVTLLRNTGRTEWYRYTDKGWVEGGL